MRTWWAWLALALVLSAGGRLALADWSSATTGIFGPCLNVHEADDDPDVACVFEQEVPNGALTDDGGGKVTIAFVGSAVGGFTEGSVIFADSSGFLDEDNANLFWNDTTNRLCIGCASPDEVLHVTGDVKVADDTPHFEWEDTDASQDDFEAYADDSGWHLTNLTDSREYLHIKPSHAVVFNDWLADQDFVVRGDTDGALLHIDAGLDTIGIGQTADAISTVTIEHVNTGTTRFDMLNLDHFINPSGNTGADHSTFLVDTQTQGGFNFTSTVNGMLFDTRHGGSGTLNQLYGVRGRTDNIGGGTITEANGFFGILRSFDSGGTMVTGAAFRAATPNVSAGAITTAYGLLVENQTAASTNYAIATEGGDIDLNTSQGTSDFNVRGDTEANVLHVDGATDRVGIATNAPAVDLDMQGDAVSIAPDSITVVSPTTFIFESTAGFLSLSDSSNHVVVSTSATIGTQEVWWPIPIPWQLHGRAVTLRSFTFYFGLNGTSPNITENLLYVHDVSAGTFTNIDNDTTDITTGTSHSSSSLPRTFTADEQLFLRLAFVVGIDETYDLEGFVATWDTD